MAGFDRAKEVRFGRLIVTVMGLLASCAGFDGFGSEPYSDGEPWLRC
jgi:hypothetical protein